MSVPFTSTSGEQKQAATLVEQFPLLIRGAWTNLTTAPGPRVRFTQAASGIPVSTLEVPLYGLAGTSAFVHPMLYWPHPYYLGANNQFRGQFINDAAQAAGNVIFYCERTDLDIEVPIVEGREYRLLLDLGLSGGASGTGNATTQQVDYDILIKGALSTSSGMNVKFVDTRQNIGWSSAQLPIGAFAGIVGGSNVEPIMRYATPYYLPRNSSIRAEWTNAGAETGKFVEFICERIVR